GHECDNRALRLEIFEGARKDARSGGSLMSEKIYPVPAEWAKRAFVDDAKYQAMYRRSVDDPDGFWAEHGKRLDWMKPFTKVKNTDFNAPVSIKWFEDGALNVSANCIDRHLQKRGDQVALLWE